MLNVLRERKGNFVFVVLLFIVCAVFIINFGPQQQGCQGCGTPTYAAEVYGDTITPGEFRSAMFLHGVNQIPAKTQRSLELPRKVLDGLVERNLLAREAARLGFRVSDEQIDEEILAGRIYVSAPSEGGTFAIFRSGPQRIDFSDDRGVFQYDDFRMFVQARLRRSLGEFKEEQRTEILADQMRKVVTSGVRVSREEVREGYVREAEEVRLGYIRFSPLYYRDAVDPTSDEVAAFRRDHGDEVDRELERTRHRYTKLDKNVRSRHILLKVSANAPQEVKERARSQIEALREKAVRGEDFGALARKYSQDPGSARRGGDLGFHARGRMVAPFEEAEFALQEGQISDVVETQFGFHVIQVTGLREGDVPDEEAKNEIADRLLRERRGADRARQAAEDALRRLRAGETLEAIAQGLQPRAESAPAAGPAAAAATAAPLADADLPEEQDDELAPKARETQKFNRQGNPIPGPSDPAPLVRAAFALTTESPVPTESIRLGDDYVVFRLVERTDATDEGFEEAFDRLSQTMLAQKKEQALGEFVARLRAEAEADGAITFNDSVLAVGGDGDDEGEAGEEGAAPAEEADEAPDEDAPPRPRAPPKKSETPEEEEAE
jgi:peptidyl-prolyl cis-trans isomerase D